MMDRSSKKSRPTSAGSKVSGRAPKRTAVDNANEPLIASSDLSAVRFDDQHVERYLLTGEHSGVLEDYFGESAYQELRQLAREAASRRARGGHRVLIVPGIMGSKIGRKRKLFNDTVWIDPIGIAAGHLLDLRLDGENSDLTALGVILLAYLRLKLRLRAAGYDVDFHPYDWRQSIARLGQELSDRLNKEKAEKISIVAHSMGGLVARSAITRNAPKRLDRVIMLGTPNHGSFAPVQVLRGIYPVLRKLEFIDLKHSARDLVDKVFRTFPSLYEMMPHPEKFSGFNLYDPANWPQSGPLPLKADLQSARHTQQMLASADDRFFLIAGVNQETVVGAGKATDEFAYDLSMEGDGTVPLPMAEMAGVKTFFIEESHGSLPNNRKVARAVDDLLADGATSVLPGEWAPQRSGLTRTLADRDFKEAEYKGAPGRTLSRREARRLLEELVSADSRDSLGSVPGDTGVILSARPESAPPEFHSIVIGRRNQHRLEVRLACGSIVDVDARAYVLGMFRDVTPAGAARSLDALLEGTINELISRRMFNGNVGEVSIIPTGRHPVRADLIAFAGLGAFDKFNLEVLEIVAENIMRTFLKTRVDDFAVLLFGGASGQQPAGILERLLTGFFRGLLDADRRQRFHGITICEADRTRYDIIKRELYRLSGTTLFDQIEVTIDEIEMPPMAERKVYGAVPMQRSDPVYLIVRCDRPQAGILEFDASILTSGAKATVVNAKKEVRESTLHQHLDRIGGNEFSFEKMETFGAGLAELVLSSDVRTILESFADNEVVVVNDAPASVIPWETICYGGKFPATAGGLSRRYLADNLSVAKWLESRKYGNRLDVLLVVNPTSDLTGAAEEGARIQKLLESYTSSIKITVLQESKARKARLLELFSSGAFDVVHYAGHAFFNPDSPERSGILCAGNEVLSGADLAGIGNLPALMFFNACEAARVRKQRDPTAAQPEIARKIQRSVGLAEAFLRGGVANYVSTYWPVGDASAKSFAEVFYKELLQGESIGRALLHARQKIFQERQVDWADYIFYGSPDFTLKVPSA